MMTVILFLLCTTSILTQVAVLRDRTIPENELVESFRWLRVAAYAIAALTCIYLMNAGYWLQPMMAVSLILLALADTVGACARLFPELVHLSDRSPPSSPRP